ncbi:hypothetical protein [Micromonospora globbae]|uniref:hypothetical protein n=1 Tax=Micromonospora globbae TaxID=1894969 RepID=UPI0037B4BC45
MPTTTRFTALITPAPAGGSARVAVGVIDPTSLDFLPIQLSINGQARLQLLIKFYCTWDSGTRFLAVDKSFFHVRLDEKDTPLFRYEYVRSAGRAIPCAHVQLHAHRDELVYLMTFSNKGRPKAHRRKGTVPRLAQLHFPLGGHRFRPCLEDVLQMLVFEFGLDTQPKWLEAIEKGRTDWREMQLKAAVRDAPDSAAEVLRALGYDVTPPTDAPTRNTDRLKAF